MHICVISRACLEQYQWPFFLDLVKTFKATTATFDFETDLGVVAVVVGRLVLCHLSDACWLIDKESVGDLECLLVLPREKRCSTKLGFEEGDKEIMQQPTRLQTWLFVY